MSGRYLLAKIGQAVVTIVLLVVLNFVLFRMMPGSPDRVLARNPNVTAEAIAATRERWGLDKPVIPDQLVAYVASIAQGDLGYSFVYRGASVADVLADRIWPTVILFGLGELIAIVVGVSLGAYTGWRRGGLIDHVGNGASLVLYATPYFLLGMVLLLVFAVGLGWFPTYGMTTVGEVYSSPVQQLADYLSHLALPLATVALGLIGQYSIVMRSSIVDTLGEEYITTAKAKGIQDVSVLRQHALPNAMLPMATLIAINLGYVVAGAITVEVVFNWPGLGTLTVDALAARDYPVLQGIFLLLSVSVVFANLIADVAYQFLDPRVKA
jgi:peptide/nickel transport system permease protein